MTRSDGFVHLLVVYFGDSWWWLGVCCTEETLTACEKNMPYLASNVREMYQMINPVFEVQGRSRKFDDEEEV